MATQVQKLTPNYKQIYYDLVTEKFPNKLKVVEKVLSKEHFTSLDVIRLNKMIFDYSVKDNKINQKHRCYEKSDIIQILNYQKEHNLTNTTVAKHFNVSRNSITKWKQLF